VPSRGDHDIIPMRQISLLCTVALALLVAPSLSSAQAPLPGGSSLNAPPLPPLPSPKIEPPVVPKMDAPVLRNYQPAPQPSFSDRIDNCRSAGVAAGLNPSDREVYARTCAN